MQINQQIAKHLRDVYFGGNWTSVNLKDVLKDVSWQQATTQVYDFNTIATLVNHMAYYVTEVTKVLHGNPLLAKDALSFAHPPIQSQKDWEDFLNRIWDEATQFATLIETLPDDIMDKPFTDEKYGNYFRNLTGITEHLHYHLGQIVLIKKILNRQGPSDASSSSNSMEP